MAAGCGTEAVGQHKEVVVFLVRHTEFFLQVVAWLVVFFLETPIVGFFVEFAFHQALLVGQAHQGTMVQGIIALADETLGAEGATVTFATRFPHASLGTVKVAMAVGATGSQLVEHRLHVAFLQLAQTLRLVVGHKVHAWMILAFEERSQFVVHLLSPLSFT